MLLVVGWVVQFRVGVWCWFHQYLLMSRDWSPRAGLCLVGVLWVGVLVDDAVKLWLDVCRLDGFVGLDIAVLASVLLGVLHTGLRRVALWLSWRRCRWL